jgi:hypothetical protein
VSRAPFTEPSVQPCSVSKSAADKAQNVSCGRRAMCGLRSAVRRKNWSPLDGRRSTCGRVCMATLQPWYGSVVPVTCMCTCTCTCVVRGRTRVYTDNREHTVFWTGCRIARWRRRALRHALATRLSGVSHLEGGELLRFISCRTMDEPWSKFLLAFSLPASVLTSFRRLDQQAPTSFDEDAGRLLLLLGRNVGGGRAHERRTASVTERVHRPSTMRVRCSTCCGCRNTAACGGSTRCVVMMLEVGPSRVPANGLGRRRERAGRGSDGLR